MTVSKYMKLSIAGSAISLLGSTTGMVMLATGNTHAQENMRLRAEANRSFEAQLIEQIYKPGVMKDEPGCVREYDTVAQKFEVLGPNGEKSFALIRPSRCKGDTTIKFSYEKNRGLKKLER